MKNEKKAEVPACTLHSWGMFIPEKGSGSAEKRKVRFSNINRSKKRKSSALLQRPKLEKSSQRSHLSEVEKSSLSCKLVPTGSSMRKSGTSELERGAQKSHRKVGSVVKHLGPQRAHKIEDLDEALRKVQERSGSALKI